MKSPVEKLKAALSGLKAVTDTEHNVIAKRAFDQIAALTTQKESLLAEIDDAAKTLNASDLGEQLLKELESVRRKAEENASTLQAITQGVREARNRLQKLREADMNTGVYRRDGGALRNPHASTIIAKA